MTPLQSLAATGTKLWLDSVDPDEVEKNLSRERCVHLAELAAPYAFVEDLLDGREEVTEEGAPGLARLIHRQSDGPIAKQPRP